MAHVTLALFQTPGDEASLASLCPPVKSPCLMKRSLKCCQRRQWRVRPATSAPVHTHLSSACFMCSKYFRVLFQWLSLSQRVQLISPTEREKPLKLMLWKRRLRGLKKTVQLYQYKIIRQFSQVFVCMCMLKMMNFELKLSGGV